MSFGMYAASVPAFLQMLKNLTAILEKAEAFAEERDIEPEVMLNWRLAPDMFPLVRQIQIAADFAKGTTARLAGAEVPKYADEEQTFAELKARIAKTVKFVEGFKPKDIDGSETRDITLAVGGQEMRFKGPISCISRCRTSTFMRRPPTTSCAAAESLSANAISSA
jgi:uncharacterized protein